MSKLMRGLMLGAMLAVLSSATAVAAQPPDSRAEAVQQFRAGERASSGQLTLSDKATQQTLAAQRYWYHQSTRPAPVAAAGSPVQPGGRNDTPVGLLAALAAAAALSLGLDAMFVRRKARKATASTAI